MLATSDTDLDQEEGYWDGATIVTLTGWAWSLGTAKVKHSEPGKLYLEDPCKQWWFTPTDMGYIFETDYSYLTDHVNAIDMPGEWAYKDGKIYIMPPEGETGETLKIEQKVRQVVVDLSKNAFVRVEGIDTYGGGMTLNHSEMCMLRDGTYRYISHYSHGMDQREGYIDARDLDNPNGAPPRGEMGIYLGGRDNIVINNKIDNSAAAGIYSCGLYEYIENNTLNDCGYMGSYVGGIFVGTQGWEDPDTPRGGNAIYHNTVYNVGRHAYGVCTHEDWYLMSYKPGVEGTAEEVNILPAFLPDEVAYNDFHEGSLTARDTGTFYLYGCVMGTDELRSRHHNNLIYNSWGWEGPMNCGLYYDGYTSQIDSYENVIFSTDDRISYKQPIYQQEASYAQSKTFLWNNTSLNYVEGGKEGLSLSDYPGGKIFMAGSYDYNENHTPYIDNIGVKTDFIPVSEGIVSDDAVIENGLFDAQKNGEYICFKDIDFDGGKKNQLALNFVADKCNTGDVLTIIVGNSITDYYTKEKVVIKNTAQYEWGVEQMLVNLVALPEKANVYIRVDDLKSFKLASIRLSSVESPMSRAKLSLYADDGDVVAGVSEPRQAPAGESHYYINNTWGTTIVKYENVKLSYECDEFLFRAASAYEYAGQPFELRAVPSSEDVKFESLEQFEERDIPVIASANVVSQKWEDFTLASVPCEKTIKPGTYNFYIVFRDPAKSTNFFWCGLGQQSKTDNSAEASASAETAEK